MGLPPVIVRVLVGAAIGAALTVGVLVAVDAVRSKPVTETATTSPPEATTTTTSEAPWVALGEVRFESTILTVTSFTVDDDRATLEYELTSLSPPLPPQDADAEPTVDDVPVLPEHWELRIRSGPLVEATTGPGSERVRFEVPSGTTLDDVEDVRIVGWRAATPLGDRVELAVESGAMGSLVDGATFVVQTVLAQTTSTIVQVDTDWPDGEWERHGGFVQPTDHGWRSTFRDGGFQLLWEGTDAPASFTLERWIPIWRPLDGDSVVWSQGADG